LKKGKRKEKEKEKREKRKGREKWDEDLAGCQNLKGRLGS